MRGFHPLPFAAVVSAVSLAAASAEELNAEETRDLLFRAPWAIQAGGAVNHFLWEPDGTLCVKQFDPEDANCDDAGEWSIDGSEVCHTLEWWGKAVDLHELCFHVVERTDGAYEAKDSNNLTALTFTVPKAE